MQNVISPLLVRIVSLVGLIVSLTFGIAVFRSFRRAVQIAPLSDQGMQSESLGFWKNVPKFTRQPDKFYKGDIR